MVKTRKYLFATMLTLLISSLVTSSIFAATSVASWHKTLAPNNNKFIEVTLGQHFQVEEGSTITILIDQYALDSNGKEDKSKTAKVDYRIYNTTTGVSVRHTSIGSHGGAHGSPDSHTRTKMVAGLYVIKAINYTDSSVAIGGNVYVSK
ncbi:hypothetical protein [Paenibacillus xylanexedens]|uniref:hypothetical protein n=1 Tax=Paenibacillus xylanexedens TaxID=528191 RepID=UPI0011A710F1|nr:hypothetical protein [Paenibacillus xylanexedens]